MKLLYLSCHEVLEAQELRIFTELGIECQSTGFFRKPQAQTNLRPLKHPLKQNDKYQELFEKTNPTYSLPSTIAGSGIVHLTSELLDMFDVIYLTHYPNQILNYWHLLKGRRVILRTIAYPSVHLEQSYKILKKNTDCTIIRMSDTERNAPTYVGEDAIITQCVEIEDYDEWTGKIPQILTICKMFAKRNYHCMFDLYDSVTKEFPRKLIGSHNEEIPYAEKDTSFEFLKKNLSASRLYFSTCSKPAPITYAFIEALCVGCPIVSIGPLLGNDSGVATFGAHNYIENGISGFWSDDVSELKTYFQILLDDWDLAKKMSIRAKEIGINTFSYQIIKEQWRQILKHKGFIDG